MSSRTLLTVLVAAAVILGLVAVVAVVTAGGGEEPETVATLPPLDLGVIADAEPVAIPLVPAVAVVPLGGEAVLAEVAVLVVEVQGRIAAEETAPDQQTLGALLLREARSTGDGATYQAAVAAFERAEFLGDDSVETAELHALARLGLGDYQGAIDLAEKVFAAEGQRPGAVAVSADASIALGDLERASRDVDSLVRQLPGHPAVLARQAVLADAAADADTAVRLAEAAVVAVAAGDVDLAWYDTFLGHLLLARGDREAASAAFAAALRVEPGFPPAVAGAAAAGGDR